MEGFEVANICTSLNQPFQLIKIISNPITNNPDEDVMEFYKNYAKVMQLNTKNIFNKIDAFISDKS